MKRFPLILFICVWGILRIANAQELRDVNQHAFKRGEKLTYRIHYGFIDAAVAQIRVTDEDKVIAGRHTYHIIGTGVSKGSFDWFFKIRDRYESYIDQDAMVPWIFIRRVNEGGYIIKRNLVFDPYKHSVERADGKNYDVPPNIQDMISSFYYARCLDFSNVKSGDVFTINSFVDYQIYPLKIKYLRKETINTDFGKIKCMVFVPVVQTGRIFKHPEDLKVWITDDDNHIPIRAQAKILFGSLRMDLQSYSGLANPISFK